MVQLCVVDCLGSLYLINNIYFIQIKLFNFSLVGIRTLPRTRFTEHKLFRIISLNTSFNDILTRISQVLLNFCGILKSFPVKKIKYCKKINLFLEIVGSRNRFLEPVLDKLRREKINKSEIRVIVG